MRRLGLLLFAVTLAPACGDDAGGADAAPVSDAAPNTGTFSLAWEISDGQETVDCGDVAGVTVSIEALEQGAAFGEVITSTCTAGTLTSPQLEVGTYSLEIELKASGSRSLLATPIEMGGVEIQKSQNADLGSVTFEVIPTGTLAFTVDADVTGTNCGTGTEDANIIEMGLELQDDQEACVPATFDIDGVGSYTNDCMGTNPPPDCIESGTEVSVADAPSGPHGLEVIGRMDDGEGGTLDCWLRNPEFTIPGNDLEVDLGLQILMPNTNEPDCPAAGN